MQWQPMALSNSTAQFGDLADDLLTAAEAAARPIIQRRSALDVRDSERGER